MDYREFLEQKTQLGGYYGFDPIELNSYLKPFQRDMVTWSLQKGRSAIFASPGLGKTLCELSWAENVARKTNKPVLIVAPLAVTYQTVREAEKFGIECHLSRDGKIYSPITVTNYEKLDLFNPLDWSGLAGDECGILKNFSGSIRNKIVEFMRKMPYRLLCSATPSPNDYPELGNCSEALGELGMVDMLNRFYKSNDNTSKVVNRPGRSDKKKVWEGKQWRFKGHAEMPFWQWVCSWAMAARMPSDLGYPDDDFILPPLVEREHIVKTVNLADGMLMPMPAVGLDEQRKERRRTIPERCEEVVKLTSDDSRQSLVWCHLNDEGDSLEKMIHGGVQVSGKDDDDTKEGKFRDFIDGGIRVLVTKPKIGAWGLNFQHCSHIATFTDHSHEARYQGIHRCHRYGQKEPVVVDTVCTEGDLNVLENVKRKAIAQNHMFENLIACMHDARGIKVDACNEDKVEMPSWL